MLEGLKASPEAPEGAQEWGVTLGTGVAMDGESSKGAGLTGIGVLPCPAFCSSYLFGAFNVSVLSCFFPNRSVGSFCTATNQVAHEFSWISKPNETYGKKRRRRRRNAARGHGRELRDVGEDWAAELWEQ